jgi:excisionase family DNA binding protein
VTLVTVDDQRRIVPIKEAARYAKLSTRTLRRYVEAGRLTEYRTGVRLVRIDLDEIDGLTVAVKKAS